MRTTRGVGGTSKEHAAEKVSLTEGPIFCKVQYSARSLFSKVQLSGLGFCNPKTCLKNKIEEYHRSDNSTISNNQAYWRCWRWSIDIKSNIDIRILQENAAVDDHLAQSRFDGEPREDPSKRRQFIVPVQRLHFYTNLIQFIIYNMNKY